MMMITRRRSSAKYILNSTRISTRIYESKRSIFDHSNSQSAHSQIQTRILRLIFRVKSLHKKPGSHTFRNTKFWFFVNYSRSDYISSHSRPSKRLYGCRHRKKSCQRETPFSDILYEDELLKDLTLESELMEVISG